MKNSTPLKAIGKFCLFCMNGTRKKIKTCPSKLCEFYNYRFEKNKNDPKKSALKTIKEFCKNCCNDKVKLIRKCKETSCSLYIFRLGKNPYKKTSHKPIKKIDSGTPKVLYRGVF